MISSSSESESSKSDTPVSSESESSKSDSEQSSCISNHQVEVSEFLLYVLCTVD